MKNDNRAKPMANCEKDGHIFGGNDKCVFCQESKPALPPIIAPTPTLEDGREVLTTAISDSIKAVSVLSTILRKLDLQSFSVADELLGNLQVAYEFAKRLPFEPSEEIAQLRAERNTAQSELAAARKLIGDIRRIIKSDLWGGGPSTTSSRAEIVALIDAARTHEAQDEGKKDA